MSPTSPWPTLGELFEKSVRTFPDRPFLSTHIGSEKKILSYAEARVLSLRWAALFISLGIRRGQSIALRGKNSPSWVLAFLGCVQAGAVVVPLDAQISDADAVKLSIAGECRLFVHDSESSGVVSLLDGIPSVSFDTELPPEYEITVATAPHDIAAILFTSGTTGHPKGAMLTHENFTSDCLLAQQLLSISAEDVFYALLPLHHAYTLLAVFLEAVSVGASLLFAEKLAVSAVLSDLKRGSVTMFLAVPLLFNKLLDGLLQAVRKKGLVVWLSLRALMKLSGIVKKTTGHNPGRKWFRSVLEQAGLASVRVCISGGGPLAPQVFRRLNELGLDFVQGYGLTETSPILALNPVVKYKESSVGRILPGVEARLRDTDAQGQGELVVKGPMVMKGYFRDPEATAAVLQDGWLRTGDVGRLDDENYLYLTGRVKSLIVSEGGKNVYPEEIEYAFQIHAEIEQILVRGWLKNPEKRTEGIEALIYPNPDSVRFWVQGKPADDAQAAIHEAVGNIVAQVNRTLLPYQKIDRFTLLESPLEMTTTRKVRRLAPDSHL
ncbi:MAG: AMP-binding protein [Spirochaetales bacterium]|nr:AMP-binding protein [Spirochaetales bacterium]